MLLPAGMVIIAAIVVPWYAALYLREGWDPIVSFLFGENLARYTEGVGVDSVRGPFFYLPVLFSDSFPWSLFLVAAAMVWVAERRILPRHDPGLRVRTLMWVWIAAIVLFFTASAAKQDLYIFPIVPAVAALGGIAIAGGLRAGWSAVRWTAAVIGVLVAISGAGLVYVLGSGNGIYALHGTRVMGIAGVSGGAGAALLACLRRPRAALLATIVTFVVLDWVFVVRVLPAFERYKPVPGFATTLAPLLRPDDLLVTYDEALPSLVYYLRRHVDPIFVDIELFEKFRSGRTVYAVLSTENYQALRDRIGVPTCELERRPTFDVKLKNMIRRDALPELVLITNRCVEKL
jgi:4-amino-4-deoxy-L-arabinose transferase-like glycosyltransferase